MELYGGGMTGKPTNYQLGGRIAKASRDRQRDSELRILEQLAERAAARKERRGLIGGGIEFAGNLFKPGLGSILRGAYDAQYQKQDYGDTKYAGPEVERLEAAEDAYKEGIPERAILGAVQANLMGDFYGDLRARGLEGLQVGAGRIGEALRAGQEAGELFGLGEGIKQFGQELRTQFGGSLGQQMLQPTSNAFTYVDPNNLLNPVSVDVFGGSMRGGGLINMMLPEMQTGGMVDRFGMDDFEEGGNGMVNPPPPPPPPPPPATPPATPQPLSYGTAMDPLLALRQIGFSDIADDPRLQQYLSDLPQFGMGYAQQLGDIQTAGQSNLANLRGQATQMAGQSGFAASGAGQRQVASALDSLRTDTARQRRGVIEGFQGDLLSAIRDIEQTAGFNFGVNSVTNPDVQSPEDILKADPTKTLEEAREEYEEMRARDERRSYG